MKKIILVLLGLVLVSGFAAIAYAQEIPLNAGTLNAELKGKEMPGPFKLIFGNEKINIFIDEIKLSAVTQDGILTGLNESHLADATMEIHTSKATLNRILTSENQGEEVKNALKNGEITYNGVGAFKKVKLFFAGIIAKIALLFM